MPVTKPVTPTPSTCFRPTSTGAVSKTCAITSARVLTCAECLEAEKKSNKREKMRRKRSKTKRRRGVEEGRRKAQKVANRDSKDCRKTQDEYRKDDTQQNR